MKGCHSKAVCALVGMIFIIVGCSGMSLRGEQDYTIVWDFQKDIGPAWSTHRTYNLGGNKILGLFNNRNPKYPSVALLRLDDIPPDTSVRLSFDLYFVGTWDSGGPLADRWTLSIKGADTLIDMTRFDYAFKNGKKVAPHARSGNLDTGRRILSYHTVDHEVTIRPEQIHGNSLVLVFKGFLTGRGTEFWALDNVKVTVGGR